MVSNIQSVDDTNAIHKYMYKLRSPLGDMSERNNKSFARYIISFPRYIISFSRYIFSFSRYIISFSRYIISFPR